MSALSNNESESSARPVFSIGQVLARLKPDFPTVSASKLRFLGEQQLVTPHRTESGYRKYSFDDLDRLRLILTLQRDNYMPLNVIRGYLEDLDAGNISQLPVSIEVNSSSTPKRYRREDIIAASGIKPQTFNDAISLGLFPAAHSYDEASLRLLRNLAALDQFGIEPRHLRMLKQAVDRELVLIESVLATKKRRQDPSSKSKLDDAFIELSKHLDEVRNFMLRSGIDRYQS